MGGGLGFLYGLLNVHIFSFGLGVLHGCGKVSLGSV